MKNKKLYKGIIFILIGTVIFLIGIYITRYGANRMIRDLNNEFIMKCRTVDVIGVIIGGLDLLIGVMIILEGIVKCIKSFKTKAKC